MIRYYEETFRLYFLMAYFDETVIEWDILMIHFDELWWSLKTDDDLEYSNCVNEMALSSFFFI